MFHFDFEDHNSMLTFDMFLTRFESMILNTLIENRGALFAGDQSPFDSVLKVALRFYDKNLLEHDLARSVNRLLAASAQS